MALKYKYDVDITEAIRALDNFESERTRVFRTAVIEGMRLVGLSSTSDFMNVRSFDAETGEFGTRTNFNKLHINTGRLARSLTDGFNLRNQDRLVGVKEGHRKIIKKGSSLAGEFGSTVPYAAIHERGGFTKPKVTKKSRGFFWFMFHKTKNPMWRAMALTKKSNFTVQIPARPYLSPALSKMEPQIFQTFVDRTKEMIKEIESGK